MGYNFDICGFQRAATYHSAQDSSLLHKFMHMGKEICIGVLSDGCSGSVDDFHYRPELGAEWLVSEFAKTAKLFYEQGVRKHDLGQKIVLAILNSMLNYQAQYPSSRWLQGKSHQYCEELVATLYGFIADEENLVLITSGDGFFFENNKVKYIPDDGIYPYKLMANSPKNQWEKDLNSCFKISLFPMDKLNIFGIASDGLKDMDRQIEKALKNSNRNPEKISWEITNIPDIPHFHDDITVIMLSVDKI